MFLDNKLKRLIDEKIAEQDRDRRRKEAAARFKGVRRNDPYPSEAERSSRTAAAKDFSRGLSQQIGTRGG